MRLFAVYNAPLNTVNTTLIHNDWMFQAQLRVCCVWPRRLLYIWYHIARRHVDTVMTVTCHLCDSSSRDSACVPVIETPSTGRVEVWTTRKLRIP